MAEPILNYKPEREEREELRCRLERAPLDHADALLAGIALLQAAEDHGVLDTLRGAIGAGGTLIGEASAYANTPEGIRTMRNLLAMARLLGELDPAWLDAVRRAVSASQTPERQAPSWWRTLAVGAGWIHALDGARKVATGKNRVLPRVSAPLVAVGIAAVFAGFWIGRHTK